MNVKRPDMAQGPKAAILEAIVLAAGAGARFGGAKLLAPWRGGVLLDAALATAFAAPARRVTVMVGAEGGRTTAAVQAFAESHGVTKRLIVVQAPDWALGLSASLKRAVASLAPDVDAAFVFLGDMPLIPPGLTKVLAEALTSDVAAAAPVFDGVLGHPALIGASLFQAIVDLEGDRGAGRLLVGLGGRLARVAVQDAGVLVDVDTPEALSRAAQMQPSQMQASRIGAAR